MKYTAIQSKQGQKMKNIKADSDWQYEQLKKQQKKEVKKFREQRRNKRNAWETKD